MSDPYRELGEQVRDLVTPTKSREPYEWTPKRRVGACLVAGLPTPLFMGAAGQWLARWPVFATGVCAMFLVIGILAGTFLLAGVISWDIHGPDGKKK